MKRVRATRPASVGLLLTAAVTLAACGAVRPQAGTGEAAQVPAPVATASTTPPAPVAVATTSPAAPPAATPGRVTTPCDTNTRPKYVYVSLRRQHMWLCAKHRVALATAITSGMTGQYTETPTGRYTIQGRNRNTVLTLNTGATYDV